MEISSGFPSTISSEIRVDLANQRYKILSSTYQASSLEATECFKRLDDSYLWIPPASISFSFSRTNNGFQCLNDQMALKVFYQYLCAKYEKYKKICSPVIIQYKLSKRFLTFMHQSRKWKLIFHDFVNPLRSRNGSLGVHGLLVGKPWSNKMLPYLQFICLIWLNTWILFENSQIRSRRAAILDKSIISIVFDINFDVMISGIKFSRSTADRINKTQL